MKASQFKFTEEEWTELSDAYPLPRVTNAGRREAEKAIGYYRWVSPHSADPILAKRLKRWLPKVDHAQPGSPECLNIVRGIRKLAGTTSFAEALRDGAVGELPMDAIAIGKVRSRLAQALDHFPQDRHQLWSWLDAVYARVHYSGGSWRSGDAELLIHRLACILEMHSDFDVIRSNKPTALALQFITMACELATESTPYKIGRSTIDRHLKGWIWERNFYTKRRLSVLETVELLQHFGAVGEIDEFVRSPERQLWKESRRAVAFWKEELEPTVNTLASRKYKGDIASAFAEVMLNRAPQELQHMAIAVSRQLYGEPSGLHQ